MKPTPRDRTSEDTAATAQTLPRLELSSRRAQAHIRRKQATDPDHGAEVMEGEDDFNYRRHSDDVIHRRALIEYLILVVR